MDLRSAIKQDRLASARVHLQDFARRGSSLIPQEVWSSLSDAKELAASENNQLTAKALWCLEQIGQIQDSFVDAFNSIRDGKYKEGWDGLERCENHLKSLDRHLTEEDGEFGLEHVRKHVEQFQELFPVKWGFSPGILYKEVRCSICDARIGLREGCEHRNGEIYSGEMCARVVKAAQILHVALVDNPAQKFSVIFPDEEKNDTLEKIQELSIQLETPWLGWSLTREDRRTHHPAFRGIGRNDRCPCGSEKKFKRCCSNKERVYPHFYIDLDP